VPSQASCATGNLDAAPPFPGQSQPDFVVCISMMQQARNLAAYVCFSSLNGKLNVRCTPPATGVWKKSTVFLVLLLGLTHRRSRCVCRTPVSRSSIHFDRIWPQGAPRLYGYEAPGTGKSTVAKIITASLEEENRLASAIYFEKTFGQRQRVFCVTFRLVHCLPNRQIQLRQER